MVESRNEPCGRKHLGAVMAIENAVMRFARASVKQKETHRERIARRLESAEQGTTARNPEAKGMMVHTRLDDCVREQEE